MKNIMPQYWSELGDKMFCELYPQLPDMNEKQKEAWEKQRIIKTAGKNVTKLAEEYIVNFDRNKMNHLIENAIADDLFLPGDLHKKLVKLGWADIFTTNYDTLLERTVDLFFREKNYQIVCSQNDIAGSMSPRIVKLHGSIPYVKPYIICDEDYRTYPVKHAAMVNTVQQAMLETRLCLIGFSGDDPNFQNWMGWIRDNMGECCPIIYLIGIYDKLSEPERKLLESRQIVIVDLSCLVEEGETDRHGVAISRFLDLLEKCQEEKDIFQDRPYPEADIFWGPKDKEKYIKDIGEYLERVAKQIQPYILLPEKIREKGEEYFTNHLRVLVNECKEQQPIMEIADIIKILRKYSVILREENAEGLEEICEGYNDVLTITNDRLGALTEISLYLAEMYRINGQKTEYEKKISLLETFISRISCYKNELLIEKIKYKIEYFEYKAAKKLVDEIEENSFEYKVKKAGFYKQLSEYEFADKILCECSAELAQMKIPKDIYASYLGYLNLCHRAGRWGISDKYSDAKYFENSYNTRQIVIKKRDDLSRTFFKDDCKESRRILSFNLNTGKSISVTHYTGVRDTCAKSFSYLITLDKLCLPLFSDLADLLPRVFNETIDSNGCTYWKLSFIARSNNDKLINQIFTREIIEASSKDDIARLFHSLVLLSDLYKDNDYFQKKYIISEKNILDILSRLVIFMPDENVIQYLKILGRISRTHDSRIDKDIHNILERISTRFNGNVAVACQDMIFKEFEPQFHLASYFSGSSFEIDEGNVQDYYISAIRLAGKEDIKERDCGISQLLLLWKNCKLEDFRKRIEIVLWDSDVLPRSALYYPFIWEELPHPEAVKFSELYYQYLLEDRYLTCVTDFGVVRTDSVNSVRIYLNFFYSTSGMSKRKNEKVQLDKELAVFMLNTAHDYILHEKSLLKDFFEKYNTERKFEYIGELTALIYIQAIDKGFVASVNSKINEIWQELAESQIVTDAIRMVSEISNGHYCLCMEIFENIVLSKNKKNYSSVFTGIRCLLFHLESKRERNVDIDSLFEKFMGSIKYLDVEYAKTIWIELTPLLMQDYLIDTRAQKYISSAIRKCMELYREPADKGQRFYMDGLFNCVDALHTYYECILDSHLEISRELEDCVAEAKVINNYEIRNIWN
ncbi:MAG: SIR2 family protein [Lachnospiraceae bacterium]|nr:SIR2 family protein [Lachnospiraceae bacterium]